MGTKLISTCLLWLLLSAGEQPDLDPNMLNAQGVRATRRGDHAAAARAFRQAYEIDPTQAKIRSNLFTALKNHSIELAQEGQIEDAIQLCSEAQVLVPSDITIASNLAIFLHNEAVQALEKQQYDIALLSIGQAERVVSQFQLRLIEPKIKNMHAKILTAQGRALFLKNDVAGAFEKYDQAVAINPEEAAAYMDRSRIYYEQNSFVDAIADLQAVRDIRGPSNALDSMIQRLKLEARSKGYPVEEEETFFVLDSVGGNTGDTASAQRLVREVRIWLTRTLTVSPNEPIKVMLYWNEPFVGTNLLFSSMPQYWDGQQIRLGAQGVDPQANEFRQVMRFHYVAAIVLNLGGKETPFWFVSGLGQMLMDGVTDTRVSGLTPRETEKLLTAGEQFLLIQIDRLTIDHIRNLTDPQLISLANLQSKSLVQKLFNLIDLKGVQQLLQALKKGVPFDQALQDVANLNQFALENEWRISVGLSAD